MNYYFNKLEINFDFKTNKHSDRVTYSKENIINYSLKIINKLPIIKKKSMNIS